MKVNGEAIYGTSASPFASPLPWGRATQKPGKLFLHVFNWPKDGALLAPLANKPAKAYLLTAPDEPLACMSGGNGLTIKLPAAAPDPVASVVVLELDGPPQPIAVEPAKKTGKG